MHLSKLLESHDETTIIWYKMFVVQSEIHFPWPWIKLRSNCINHYCHLLESLCLIWNSKLNYLCLWQWLFDNAAREDILNAIYVLIHSLIMIIFISWNIPIHLHSSIENENIKREKKNKINWCINKKIM